MYATPFCAAPRQFCGPTKFATIHTPKTACPVRVKPFAYRVPTVIHGHVRRDQVTHDIDEAAKGCVFSEPPMALELPREAYGGAMEPAIVLATHDWTLDGVPGVSGSSPPPNNGVEAVERHEHLFFLSSDQLLWISKENTLIVTTTTTPSNLAWLKDGQGHVPAWADPMVHPSQRWRLHTHTFALRDDGWHGVTGARDWSEWGWSPRPGQPSG